MSEVVSSGDGSDRANGEHKRARRWLGIALVGSLIVGGGEIAEGKNTHSSSLIANATELLDGITYYSLMMAFDREQRGEHKYARRHKIMAGAGICAASTAVIGLSVHALEAGSKQKPDVDTVAIEAIATGLNLTIMNKLGPHAEYGTASRAGWRHSFGDSVAAIPTFVGVVAGGLGSYYFDPACAIAASAIVIGANLPLPHRVNANNGS